MKISTFYIIISILALWLCATILLGIDGDADALPFFLVIGSPIAILLLVYLYRNAPPKK